VELAAAALDMGLEFGNCYDYAYSLWLGFSSQ